MDHNLLYQQVCAANKFLLCVEELNYVGLIDKPYALNIFNQWAEFAITNCERIAEFSGDMNSYKAFKSGVEEMRELIILRGENDKHHNLS